MRSSRGAVRGQSWTAELPVAAREFVVAAGVEWEPVNEGGLRAFARYAREYVDECEDVLRAGLRIMTELGRYFRGPLHRAMLAEYREDAEGQIAELARGPRACADKLDVAAEVIAVMQSEVVEELAALAADRSRPAEVRAAAARRHVAHLEEHLLEYVTDQVEEVAVARLLESLDRMSVVADRSGSAALLEAWGRGEGVGPGHRVDSVAELRRAAAALDRQRDRTVLAGEAFRARAGSIDYGARPGPDEAVHRGFLIDRGSAAAVFGADRMVTLTAPEALARIAHRPSLVFLRDIGLPGGTVFFAPTPEFRAGRPRAGGGYWMPYSAPSDAEHWLHLGGFGEHGIHLDTRTGGVYCLPGGGVPQSAASSLDGFVRVLAALEAERPLCDRDRQRFDYLDPEGVEDRLLALLGRTDPAVPLGQGAYWSRLLAHVHDVLSC